MPSSMPGESHTLRRMPPLRRLPARVIGLSVRPDRVRPLARGRIA